MTRTASCRRNRQLQERFFKTLSEEEIIWGFFFEFRDNDDLLTHDRLARPFLFTDSFPHFRFAKSTSPRIKVAK